MKRKPFFQFGVLALFTVLLPGPILAASLGSQFSYQGFLVRNAAPANGLFDLQFGLRDAPLGGNPVGTPITLEDAFVTNGLFTVTLDFGEGIFSGQARWLDIAVRNGSETGAFLPLPPRDALVPTPHAHYARLAGTMNWSGLTGVPVGFADGIDQDTTYSAGLGLTLSGQQFAVAFGGVGLLNTAARSDHHHDGTYAPQVHTHDASELASGTLPSNRLSGTYSQVLALSNPLNQFLGVFSGQFTGGGAGLLNVNANTLDGLDSTAFWKTDGNAGTLPGSHFLGTSDNQPLEFRAANQSALRLVPGPVSPNIVGGYASNKVSIGVSGSSIGGGGSDEATGPMDGPNRIDANFATIAGGNRNSVTAGGNGATVSGGNGNTIEAAAAVIGGGQGNRIFSSADYALIPGGRSNEVSAPFGVAMGRGARANHEGAFVWADASSPNPVLSTQTNQMTLRASNGMRLTANAGDLKHVDVGERYRDNSIIAWAKINANGTINTNFGVVSIDHDFPGIYDITIDAATANPESLVPVASPLLASAPTDALSVRFLAIRQLTSIQFRVFVNNGNYAPVDTAFTFMATGR